ncbi:MAG: tyrosine-type recombinase/integrase, partial [Acidimicrobiales bacterium]
RAVALVIKKHAQRIGRDPAEFAGHSLRRGFSTEASRNGAPERTIAATTGHTSAKGLRPYIEDAETFTDPPSRYLGL